MKIVMKILLWGLGIIVVVALVLGGLFLHQIKKTLTTAGKIVEWNDSEGTTYKDLRYGDGTRNTYDLIIPANGQPTALMLFIHGGAWMGGNKEDMTYEAHRFAKRGYATATINYTRIGADSLDYHSQYEYPCFPSMMDEINRAIGAIKIKGEKLGLDFKQMAIGGYSAGGHLAMLYATQYATTSPIPIKFQISWVGPSDINMMFPSVALSELKSIDNLAERGAKEMELFNFIRNIVGYTPDIKTLSLEDLEHLKMLGSPVHFVSENTPAAILAYGAKDGLVSSEQGQRMANVLNAAGVENRLFVFPNSGHELGQDKEYTEMLYEAIGQFCEKYFE